MPFCENCGNKLSESTKFCSNCGLEIKKLEESFSHDISYENQVHDKSKSLKSTEKNINQRHEDNESVAEDLSRPLMEGTPKVLHSIK